MSHFIHSSIILASLLFGPAIASAQDLSSDSQQASPDTATSTPDQSASDEQLSSSSPANEQIPTSNITSSQPQVSFDIFHADSHAVTDDETVTPASDTDDNASASSTSSDDTLVPSAQNDSPETEIVLEHGRKFAFFDEDRTINVKLITSAGDIECSLYAGTHPATVLNFLALAEGTPPWTDASGTIHSDPYYKQLKFGKREKGKYVTSGLRPEGTSFVIADERCSVHTMKAGAIAMVQPYPGQASTQFMLLARDLPLLNGMYSVFGECTQIDTIKKLTSADATLDHIERIP